MIYWACSTTLGSTTCRLTSYVQWLHTFRLSKYIDSMNAQNSFLCLVMRSSLLAGQVLVCCFRTSRWALVFAHWSRIWSTFWYSLPHVHVASSLRWNRCRYAFVIPCPVSTVDIFGVSFILDLSLSWTVGKYCLVAAAFWLVVHSHCHLCLASWYNVLFGILVNTFSVPPHRATSFASLSAISLPSVPAWALTQENFILHSLLSRLATCFLISCTRNEWFFALRSESRETRLSVYDIYIYIYVYYGS